MKNTVIIVILVVLSISLISCCTSKDTNIQENGQIKMLKKSHASQLPPGTADITATVLSLETKDNVSYALIKIDTVHGYGASTRPLAEGSEIKVLITKTNEESISKILKPKSAQKMRVRFSAKGMGQSGRWEIISLR